MTTRTFGQDFNALGQGLGDGIAAFGGVIRDGVKGMTPLGRRFAVTTLGAVLALGLGVATAATFRLPSEVTDPAQPQDQILAQSELPSEAAARAYALENPPTYTAASNNADDATPVIDTSAVMTSSQDDPAPAAAVYTPDSDDAPATAKPADVTTISPTAAADAND